MPVYTFKFVVFRQFWVCKS